MTIKENSRVRKIQTRTLSKGFSTVTSSTFEYLRSDGVWQQQTREVYDRGDGAVVLLFNRARHTVILIRQFRFPIYARQDHDGFLIEAAAGALDQANPEERIKAEIKEETGYEIDAVKKIFEVFASPGSMTEKLHFFVAEYEPHHQTGQGGGLDSEGEDIEVLEVTIDDAMKQIAEGKIQDSKTVILLQYAKLNLFS